MSMNLLTILASIMFIYFLWMMVYQLYGLRTYQEERTKNIYSAKRVYSDMVDAIIVFVISIAMYMLSITTTAHF